MVKNKKKDNEPTNNKDEDFPKITIDSAIEYLEGIATKSKGDLVTYEDIGKAIGKAGGNLARITGSLKQFNLLEKGERPKEWKITNLGDKIIKNKSESDMIKAFLNPSIHTRIWNEYKQNKPSNAALENYLKRQGFAPKAAKKLTKLFLNSYDQFSMKMPLSLPKDEEKSNKENIENKDENKKIYLVYLLSSLFPPKLDDVKKTLAEIIKIAKDEKLNKLATTAEFLEIQISNTPKENIKSELEKFSGQVKKIMKEELGIEINSGGK